LALEVVEGKKKIFVPLVVHKAFEGRREFPQQRQVLTLSCRKIPTESRGTVFRFLLILPHFFQFQFHRTETTDTAIHTEPFE
jgi:hypothetical protein